MSHPRFVAMKGSTGPKPWAVGELTSAPGAFDYREVAAYATLREANADIEQRRVQAASERTAKYRAGRAKRRTRGGK